MIVGLSSEELSLIEMSVLARWTIGPRLMGVPGVANVAIWGQRERQLQVQVDPEQLQDTGVTLEQVVETTGNALWVSSLSFLEASTPGTGGFIDTPNQRLGIWHVLPISSPEDLAQVPVDGTAWLLGDVAKVVEDHQPLIGDAVVNDDPEPAAGHRKTARDQHPGGDPGGGSSAGCAAARFCRYRVRRHDLPAGDLHRDGHRQSHPDAAHQRFLVVLVSLPSSTGGAPP